MNALEFRRVSRRFYTLFNRAQEFCSIDPREKIYTGFYDRTFTMDVTVPTLLGERLIRFFGKLRFDAFEESILLDGLVYFDGIDETADKLFTIFLFPYSREIVIDPALVQEHLTPQKCLDAIKEVEDKVSEMLKEHNRARYREEHAKEEFVDLLIGV